MDFVNAFIHHAKPSTAACNPVVQPHWRCGTGIGCIYCHLAVSYAACDWPWTNVTLPYTAIRLHQDASTMDSEAKWGFQELGNVTSVLATITRMLNGGDQAPGKHHQLQPAAVGRWQKAVVLFCRSQSKRRSEKSCGNLTLNLSRPTGYKSLPSPLMTSTRSKVLLNPFIALQSQQPPSDQKRGPAQRTK
jgi:hypothetical protein